MDLKNEKGEIVKPLTGDEISRFRAEDKYNQAVGLVVAKWRKAIIGLSVIVGALAFLWQAFEGLIKKASEG